MHPNKAFRANTTEHNLDFARHRGFGVLTLSGPEGPLASHIPFVLSDDGSRFGAHLVRSNPMLNVLSTVDEKQPALMIVSGPDGYISPDWYGIEDQVPTWNYIAVHLYGTVQRLPDDRLKPHLEALSYQFESRLAPKPIWKLDKVNPDTLARMQRSIAPIEFTIEQVEGTWKLGQNKGAEVQQNAAKALVDSEQVQMISDLAEMMLGDDPDR